MVNVLEMYRAAMQRQQAGRVAEAESIYRQILAIDPRHAAALNHLGVIAAQAGRKQEALTLLRESIAIEPNQPEAYANLGTLLSEIKRPDMAVAAFGKAIELNPAFAHAHNNLGNVLADLGRFEEAVLSLRQALRINGNYPEALYNLANLFKRLERWDEAIEFYHQALMLRPTWREAENNLGNTLLSAGKFDEAERIFRLGVTMRGDDPLTHWNMALMLLRRGDFRNGWTEYESRWQIPELRMKRSQFSQPAWDGSELNGKTILLYSEQGLGDSIQFARYVPLVARRGGKVLLSCQPELVELLKTVNGVAYCQAQPGFAALAFDTHCTLPTLPRVMGTNSIGGIPADIPYIKADPAISQKWKERLAGDPRKKIGLVWSGSKLNPHHLQRTLKLEWLAPLAEAGARSISLQKGEASAEVTGFTPVAGKIEDWTSELTDFAQTGGLVENLDLVITIDTAAAHLAGAMGKNVWVMLPFVPDWRWMLNRPDSPWYPSMRLFRQPRWADWTPVVRQVADELKELCRA